VNLIHDYSTVPCEFDIHPYGSDIRPYGQIITFDVVQLS